MRFGTVAAFLMCGAALLAPLNAGSRAGDSAAQKNPEAEVLFQAAAHADLVEGDLEKAIRLYRDVVTRFAAERAIAAQALVKLGACYQRIGREEARTAYERVLRDYADQADAVRVARAKLQELAGPPAAARAGGTGPTYRLVVDRFTGVHDIEFFPHQYDFAPDGRRFVFRRTIPEKQTALLFIGDIDGGPVRELLQDTGAWWGFQYPRWSPHGNRIAYLVHKAPYAEKGPWGIFVARADTGKSAQIGADFPDHAPPRDLAWTADSREITYVVGEGEPSAAPPAPQGIYSRSIESGETRVVQAMPAHWSLRLGGYSPDGRWLAFHQSTGAGGERRAIDVWLLPAKGGRALRLTHGLGPDAQPAWAPDSRGVYFVSDRSGDLNVWKVGIDPSTGLATGEPQQVTFFTDGHVMHPRLAAGGRRMTLTISRIRTVIKVGSPDHPEEAREITRGRAPQLSPDGCTLYFLGEGPDQQGLYAMATSGPARTRLTPIAPDTGFDLSPDGRTLTYFAKDGAQTHLYTLPVTGGEPTRLVERVGTADATPIQPPRWSPDGSRIAYAQDHTLFSIAGTGGQPRKLAQLYRWEEWLWAPDGQSIAALAYAAPEDIAVFVIPAEGGEARRLTDAAERAYKEGLAWHPDSKRLAYMIYAGPGERDSELREAYVDGRSSSTLIRVTDDWEYVGRWTPDGKQFLYLTLLARESRLHAFDPATRTSRLLMENVQSGVSGLAHGLVTWSADMSVMAWAASSQSSQLWVAENFR